MTTPTTEIDTPALDRLLLQVEALAHRGGWDGQPQLYVVYDGDHADTASQYRHLMGRYGVAVRAGRYAAQPMVPAEALDGYASHALFRMALNLGSDHPAAKLMIEMLRAPGFLGLALLCESWTASMEPEEREALGARRLADVPGSREARIVTSGDIAGGVRYIQRTRGEKPRVVDFDGGVPGGSIPESLCYAAAAVAGRPLPKVPMPPSAWPSQEASR